MRLCPVEPRQGRCTRYVRSDEELGQALLGAKLLSCPHCGAVVTLNGHGWLRGYAEAGQERIVRGRRLFCSNRFRRPGCGRTCRVVLAGTLAGFLVTAATLACFVLAVLAGASRKAAWERVVRSGRSELSLRSGYRLWRRLERARPHIATRLCAVGPPPPSSSTLPIAQLVAHLESVLPGAECAFAAFQLRFQASLLG